MKMLREMDVMKVKKIITKFIVISCIIAILGNLVPMPNMQAEEVTQYFQESIKEIDNPERGFYEPVGYKMEVSDNEILDLDYNLIHLRVGISAFSRATNGSEDIPFTMNMINALDGTLKNIKKNGGSVIIRFAYDDFDGKKDLEPSMEMMLHHIKQLKCVFEQNKDVIAYVELGLFGPWGEMHSSEICTTENVSMALEAMLEAVPEDITIGVRTPRYYAKWANVERNQLDLDITQKGTKAYRVGLYNDGYLGSESDLGTFSDRDIETTWLSNQASHTFYGGEVVASRAEGEPLNTVAYMSQEAFKTHTTYLNRYWNNSVIDSWKEEIYKGEDTRYQGQSGYTYIVNHLGYRFVLRQCQMDSRVYQGQSFNLEIKIENVGFANLINGKKVSILLEGENNAYEITTDIDARKWNSKELTNIKEQISLPYNIAIGEYKVYFRISKLGDYTTDNNYQCIQFANDGIWKESIGANMIGSICVLEQPEPEVTTEKPRETLKESVLKPEQSGETQGTSEDEETESKKDASSCVLVKRITINGISKKIAAGKRIKLKTTILPYYATNKTLKWKCSNEKYATVNQEGVVKIKKAGVGHSVTIKAMATDGSNVTSQYKIKIMKNSVKKLTVKVSKKEVKAGKRLKIKAVISPNRKVNSILKYISSNTKYAIVNQKGIIKTKKAGKGRIIKIKVMTTDGSNLNKTIKIKIN